MTLLGVCCTVMVIVKLILHRDPILKWEEEERGIKEMQKRKEKKKHSKLFLLTGAGMVTVILTGLILHSNNKYNEITLLKAMYSLSKTVTKEEMEDLGYIDVSDVHRQKNEKIENFLQQVRMNRKAILKTFQIQKGEMTSRCFYHDPQWDFIRSWRYFPWVQVADVREKRFSANIKSIEQNDTVTLMLTNVRNTMYPKANEIIEDEILYSYLPLHAAPLAKQEIIVSKEYEESPKNLCGYGMSEKITVLNTDYKTCTTTPSGQSPGGFRLFTGGFLYVNRTGGPLVRVDFSVSWGEVVKVRMGRGVVGTSINIGGILLHIPSADDCYRAQIDHKYKIERQKVDVYQYQVYQYTYYTTQAVLASQNIYMERV